MDTEGQKKEIQDIADRLERFQFTPGAVARQVFQTIDTAMSMTGDRLPANTIAAFGTVFITEMLDFVMQVGTKDEEGYKRAKEQVMTMLTGFKWDPEEMKK